MVFFYAVVYTVAQMSSKTISPSFNNLDLLLEAFASHQKQTGNTAEKFQHDEKKILWAASDTVSGTAQLRMGTDGMPADCPAEQGCSNIWNKEACKTFCWASFPGISTFRF